MYISQSCTNDEAKSHYKYQKTYIAMKVHIPDDILHRFIDPYSLPIFNFRLQKLESETYER